MSTARTRVAFVIDRGDVKQTLRDIAILYERMAEHVEKLARQQAPKGPSE